MKYKILLLIIFPFFIFQTGKSQNSFPTFADSPRWNILLCVYGIGYSCNTMTYQYECDTLFCGHVYSKIKTTMTGTIGFIRSDSSHVYIRTTNSCSDKEYLMYDFSINMGDTIYLAYDLWNGMNSDTTRYVLDSIKTGNYNGIERRIYFIKYEPDPVLSPNWFGRHMTWIEGIGSTTDPFFPLDCIHDNCESSLLLLCFDSLGIQLYQDPYFKTCDTTYSDAGTNDLTFANHLNFFPNPAKEKLTIEILQKSTLEILNIQGQIILQLQLQRDKTEIDISGLSKGVYILRLNSDGKTHVRKIVKE